MVTELITHCPQCQTSFKVTAEQLKVANGLVRCGSCLNVFNAEEYAEQNSSTPEDNQSSDDLSTQAIDDLFDQDTISEIDQNFDITDDSVNEFISSESSDDDEENKEFLSLSDEMSDDEVDADELFGGSSISSAAPQSQTTRPSNHKEETELEDDWAEELLKKLDSPNEENDHLSSSASHKAETPNPFTSEVIQPSSDSSLKIESEPVYLSTEPTGKDTELTSTVVWSIACLIAIATLLLQVAWMNFNSWSKLETLRPYYMAACTLLECKVPSIQSVEQVRASNLIVRTAPDNSTLLMVDAILTNKAPFTQNFPKIALIFSNNQGEAVASGLVSPSDYLGGELAGAVDMEKNVPVHISFKIEDPGADARSYHLELYP